MVSLDFIRENKKEEQGGLFALPNSTNIEIIDLNGKMQTIIKNELWKGTNIKSLMNINGIPCDILIERLLYMK